MMPGESPPPMRSPDRGFTVVEADDGERIDRVVGTQIGNMSRRVARSLCQAGAVRVDGRKVPASERVRTGQCVLVQLPTPAVADAPPLRVLAVDDDFVFVDKPASMHTVRLHPSDPTTLADQVAARFPECATASGDRNEGGALHRLDFGTSGVVAFARGQRAHTLGRSALRDGLKLYLAICRVSEATAPGLFSARVGTPPPACVPWREAFPGWTELPVAPATRIDAPLLGRGARGRTVSVDPEGQPSTTLAWDLGPVPDGDTELRWMLVQLLTGRRHQARVHLAHIGRPILSDAAYANQFDAPHRPLLHAWALGLDRATPLGAGRPAGSAAAIVSAPVPPDFPAKPTGAPS